MGPGESHGSPGSKPLDIPPPDSPEPVGDECGCEECLASGIPCKQDCDSDCRPCAGCRDNFNYELDMRYQIDEAQGRYSPFKY